MRNKNHLGAVRTTLGNSQGDVMTAVVNSIGSGGMVATLPCFIIMAAQSGSGCKNEKVTINQRWW